MFSQSISSILIIKKGYSKIKKKSQLTFDISPVPKLPSKPKIKITPVKKKPKPDMLSKDVIIAWNLKYDEERRIGTLLRSDKEFGLDILKEIIHWKFYTLPGR